MNIRGKSSPAQSNIRTVNAQAPRGPTATPPPQQLRPGAQFDEGQQHYQYQAVAAASYQQPQQFVEMNKPAPGRVSGPGLPQAQQSYTSVPRAQPVNQYSTLLPDTSDQSVPMYPPQQSIYISATNPQNMRQQQRMPTMNNNQVPSGNMAFMTMPSNMSYLPYGNTNQMPFVPNANQQYMYTQRMQYQPMQQTPAPINYMQFQAGPYYQGGMNPYQGGMNPLQMAPTRPSSVAPPVVSAKVMREKKAIPIVNPETMTPINVIPEHQLEEQHALDKPPNPVAMEFTRKVALTLVPEHSHHLHFDDQQQAELEVDHTLQSVTQQFAEGQQIMNGEADIQETLAMGDSEFSVPSDTDMTAHAQQPEGNVIVAAYASAQLTYPSDTLHSLPLLSESVTAPTNIVAPAKSSPAHVLEKVPENVFEKEPSPPAAASVEPEPESVAVKMQSTTVSAAAAASMISDAAVSSQLESEPSPVSTPAPASQSQASGPPPAPQRQDPYGRKGKKKRDLNKKSKEGSDMDAFYDMQASQDSLEAAEETVPDALVSTTKVAPLEGASPKETYGAPTETYGSPTETCFPQQEISSTPKETVPNKETIALPKETFETPAFSKEIPVPSKEMAAAPPKEIFTPPKEIFTPLMEIFTPGSRETFVLAKETVVHP